MAGWPASVCYQFCNGEQQCAAAVERATARFRRGFFVSVSGSAAGDLYHSGFHEFGELDWDHHEYIANEWFVANYQCERRRAPTTLLPCAKGSLNSSAQFRVSLRLIFFVAPMLSDTGHDF